VQAQRIRLVYINATLHKALRGLFLVDVGQLKDIIASAFFNLSFCNCHMIFE
jgi:hypothetical protein